MSMPTMEAIGRGCPLAIVHTPSNRVVGVVDSLEDGRWRIRAFRGETLDAECKARYVDAEGVAWDMDVPDESLYRSVHGAAQEGEE